MIAILNFRNTPQQSTNYSPAEQLINRKTKTLLPERSLNFKSSVPFNIKEKLDRTKHRQTRYYDRNAKSLCRLRTGETMKIQPKERNKTCKKGIVVRKPQTRSYDVRKEDSTVINRNRRQHCKTNEHFNEKEREETVDLPTNASSDELNLPLKIRN
jgi:hypothetical protein